MEIPEALGNALGAILAPKIAPGRKSVRKEPFLDYFWSPRPSKTMVSPYRSFKNPLFDENVGSFFSLILEPFWLPKWSQNGCKSGPNSILNSIPFSVPFLIDFWMIFGAQTLPKTMVSLYRSFKNHISRPLGKMCEKVAKTIPKRSQNGGPKPSKR